MAAVKVIMLNLHIVSPDLQRSLVRKMGPPLVTMISSAPEVQYVALRNIALILQKQPDILSKEWRIFCCRYNDPDYLKHEKLDIMVKLANDKNVDQLLTELKECNPQSNLVLLLMTRYASEIDIDFVRRAVRAIGQCALKIPEASERSITVLLDLVATKVNYVVQEAVCVIKDILRKYPHRYENVIPMLAENLDVLDDPAARASLIWMIGEYAEKITNAGELLETFLDAFKDEPTSVIPRLVPC
jgi:AP-1 complex subunit beta-1